LRVPSGIGIRDDSGVYEGFEVSTFYDPMISKLIAWGTDREEAIGRMLRALSEYTVVGPIANVAFHRWALEHPAFRAGDIDTGFIARHFRPAAPDAADDLPVIGAAIAAVSRLDGTASRPGASLPGLAPSRWRTLARREVRAAMPGKVVAVLIEAGAAVTRGQGLLVIEAMKMENEVVAPRDGTVQEIRVQPGQAVEAGELLAVVE